MATHHSKTSRTKSPHAEIVVPRWDDVWQSFKEANETTTIEAMNAEGWKTIQQAADAVGLSRPRINQLAIEGKLLEREVKKVVVGGKIREINFVKPKTTTCQ